MAAGTAVDASLPSAATSREVHGADFNVLKCGRRRRSFPRVDRAHAHKTIHNYRSSMRKHCCRCIRNTTMYIIHMLSSINLSSMLKYVLWQRRTACTGNSSRQLLDLLARQESSSQCAPNSAYYGAFFCAAMKRYYFEIRHKSRPNTVTTLRWTALLDVRDNPSPRASKRVP